MSDVTLDGERISAEQDVHDSLAEQLGFGEYYGRNLAALRDRLSTDVPRPVVLTWRHSDVSRARLGEALFGKPVEIFDEITGEDNEFGYSERFEFRLD